MWVSKDDGHLMGRWHLQTTSCTDESSTFVSNQHVKLGICQEDNGNNGYGLGSRLVHLLEVNESLETFSDPSNEP